MDDEDDWWRGRGEGDREDVVHEAGVREDVCGNAGDACGEMNEFCAEDFSRIDERKGVGII